MKQYTKRVLVLPVTIAIMVFISLTWYLLILRPQKKTAITFVASLVRRDLKMLQQTVEPKEFETYKYLYCTGFTKQLLSYSNLKERDANGFFFPTSSRFSIDVEEKDVFFGVRKLTYFIVLEKKTDKWRVIQFSSLEDRFDLEQLRKVDK